LNAPSRSFARFEAVGLQLVAALAATCSFDASRLRASAPNTPDAAVEASPVNDTGAPYANGDTGFSSDAPTGPGKGDDAAQSGEVGSAGGAGGSDTPVATKDASSPLETGTTSIDGPIATGGVDGTDAPVGAGGAGGMGGAGGAVDATGSDTAVALGGSATDDASGGVAPTGGEGGSGGVADIGGQTDTGGSGAGAGGDTGGSGGQMDTGGSGGAGGSDIGGSGGQTDTGGSGGAGAAGAAGATGPDGGLNCSSQCPPIATVGITGVWAATYSNGKSGNVVTTGDAVFLSWLTTRGTSCVVQNLDITGTNYLTATRIAPYRILIVLDIYHTQADKNSFFNTKKTNTGYPPYPGYQRALLASEVNAVRDWVNSGGGLMTTIGTASTAAEMANANLLLNPFGIAYSVTDVNILSGNSLITTFSTAATIANQITAGVKTLPAAGAAGIEGLAGGNLPTNSSTFSLYASAPNGGGRGGYGSGVYALGVAKIVNGSGHVNVWGDETITYDSAWSNSAYQTQIYWNNVLTWLGQCP
jgi:hypothetical protein